MRVLHSCFDDLSMKQGSTLQFSINFPNQEPCNRTTNVMCRHTTQQGFHGIARFNCALWATAAMGCTLNSIRNKHRQAKHRCDRWCTTKPLNVLDRLQSFI